MNNKRILAVVSLALSVAVLLFISYTWDAGWRSMAVTGALLVLSRYLSEERAGDSGYSVRDFAIAGGIGFLYAGIVTDHPFVCSVAHRLHIPWYLVWIAAGMAFTVLLVPVVSYVVASGSSFCSRRTDALDLFLCRACAVLATVGIGLQVIFSFSGDIWADEAWTMRFIAPMYGESIELIASDVHPPLYYLIVKGIIDVVHLCGLNVRDIYVAKLVSVLPIFALVIVGLTYIRRRYGKLEGSTFAALVACSSPLLNTGVEVRMYSWALLFVTLTYLYAERIIRQRGKWNWVGFVLFSLCAAYTHYFAIVAVIPAYIYTLAATRRYPWPWLLSCTVVVVSYTPWLLVFIEQVSQVRESYWIPPVRLSTVVSWLHDILPIRFFVPVYLLLACLVCLAWKRKDEREEKWIGAGLMIVPLFVVFVGLMASMALRPVFVARYMHPALGCLWLGVVSLLPCVRKNNVSVMISFCVIALSVAGLLSFRTEYNSLQEHEKFVAFASNQKNAIYISSNSHPHKTVTVITDCAGYSWKKPSWKLSQRVFGVSTLHNAEDLRRVAETADVVYFLSTARKEIEEFQAEVPYECDYLGDYRIGMKCGVYRVNVK